jgi:PAS domain S-box-containing protein
MLAQYNQWIVALSYVVAVMASYVALDMASRVSAARGSAAARYWLVGGALAMGVGIWSMHFVGMLAFSLPIPIPYSVPTTFLSMLFAVAASGTALQTINRGALSWRRLIVAGIIMGGGVSLMHYTGMAALEVFPGPTYHRGLFVLSIAIAVVASIAAMWISFQLKSDTILTAFWKKSASAMVMGVAIWGMHFTAMAAAVFAPNSYCLGNPASIDNKWLAATVGFCSLLFFVSMLLVSILDARMAQHRKALQAESERFFNQSLDLLCICGFDGYFRRLNPAWESVLGTARRVLMARPFIDATHPDDRRVVIDQVERLGVRQVLVSVETRLRCADGSYRCFAWNATPLEDGTGFYATGHDITDGKLADAELRITHERLVEASRAAGMAEVATNVLHNVGNVLNSVNVSANVVIDSVRQCRVGDLERVLALLTEHSADLPAFFASSRGAALLPYLGQLAARLRTDQQEAIRELTLLRENIDHIKEIVMMQQNTATLSGATEMARVADLVEDSLRLNSGTLTRHHVEVERDYAEVPQICVQKHKVLQILVNLIRNAKFACVEARRSDRRIVVRISRDEASVRIAVIDNGIGIPAGNLARIFSHGFTTRKDGHGFGLHSGALAAREMGGALQVQSEGAGCGATFTLQLPLPAAMATPSPDHVLATA